MSFRNLVLAHALIALIPTSVLAQDAPSRNPYTSMQFMNPFLGAKGKNKSEGESLEGLQRDLDAGKYKKAYSRVQSRAYRGMPEFQAILGQMYLEGKGTKQDSKEALNWLFKAATSNNTKAQTLLGKMLYEGKGVDKNPEAARKWFSKAATNNDAIAKYYLGVMYATGKGVDKNPDKAKEYFLRAYPIIANYLKQGDWEDGQKHLDSIKNDYRSIVGDSIDKAKVRALPKTKISQNSGGIKIALPDLTPDKTKAEPSKPENFNLVLDELEKLIKEFYKGVEIKKSDNGLHFQFSCRQIKSHRGEKQLEYVPKLNGIFGDITWKAGRYPGKEYLPATTHDVLYSSLLMAPYCEKNDCHLLTELRFPPTVSTRFIGEFKSIVGSFEQSNYY